MGVGNLKVTRSGLRMSRRHLLVRLDVTGTPQKLIIRIRAQGGTTRVDDLDENACLQRCGELLGYHSQVPCFQANTEPLWDSRLSRFDPWPSQSLHGMRGRFLPRILILISSLST